MRSGYFQVKLNISKIAEEAIMFYAKRFWIALIFGVITGVVCALLSMKEIPDDYRTMMFLTALLNRAFIGFAIGISCWRIGWLLHGILIGFIGSLPMGFPMIFTPDAGFVVFILIMVGGIVWGFLIELFTTVIFKAPMKSVEA